MCIRDRHCNQTGFALILEPLLSMRSSQVTHQSRWDPSLPRDLTYLDTDDIVVSTTNYLNFSESGLWGRFTLSMKAHQKWNIAAQVGLGISIVLAILATWMLMTYIVPKLIFFHQEKGSVLPAYFQMPLNVCEITTRYWYLWTPILLSLIHIWRCRRSYACRSRWSPYH